MFTLTEIARFADLPAKQLHLWRARHDVPRALPLQQQRKYPESEAIRAINAAILYKNGWKISRIAKLTSEELGSRASQLLDASLRREKYESVIQGMIRSVLDFDPYPFRQLYHSARKRMVLSVFIDEIILPCMSRLELLWHGMDMGLIHRDVASDWLEELLRMESTSLNSENKDRPLMFVWSDLDDHPLTILLLSLQLAQGKYSTFYLGQSPGYDLQIYRHFPARVKAGLFVTRHAKSSTLIRQTVVLPYTGDSLDILKGQAEEQLELLWQQLDDQGARY